MARAVQGWPDELGHPGVEDDLASGPVAHVEDPSDEPAGACDEDPTRFDGDAHWSAVVRDRGKQWTKLTCESLRGRCRLAVGHDREPATEIHGIERVDRSAPERGQRERLPDRIAPGVD